ncbi:hypothetical protein BGZ76_006374 [Entomortierella beljakovae]|nr:hypothetical protein BGZ76_006374 [Entomortierella beljakovae]
MHQINLFTPIVLQNFLNEGILSKYDRLSIELIFQPEARIHSPLKTFWNCPQTADVLILSEIPGENPLFVHRKFVLDAIPKIHSVANLYRERYSQDPLQKRYMELLDPILDELFVSLKRKMKCEESSTILPCKDSTDRTDKRPITGTKSFNDRNITCASGKPSTSSRDTLLESPKERAMPNKSTNGKETPTQNTFLHSCTPPKNTSLQSNAPLKNPGLITDRYEIWIWPGTFPKNSCIDVMRWVYFQQLSPTFCLHDFNPFMKLLEDLGEWHHFQEQALRARSSILSNKELLDYISEPCFQQGFAKEILRDCLTTKMKAKLFTLARDAFADLIERDKTGVISEFFQSIGLRLDDPSN